MTKELQTDIAIIGAGTAGLYAMREVKRAGRSFLLIDGGPLGTTCARVGCMPSKVALHTGAQWAARKSMVQAGIAGAEALTLDRSRAWQHVREHRDTFAASAAKKAITGAGEYLLNGHARFLEPTLLLVDLPDGPVHVRAKAVIIANGSRPVMPGWLEPVKERVVTTDQLFELAALPDSIGVLGLGAIGLEMGLALSRMGITVVGADLAPTVAGIGDPDLARHAIDTFGQEMAIWVGQATAVEAAPDGVILKAGDKHQKVELLLASLGRRPNTDSLDLAAAGLPVNERGTPLFDVQTLQIENQPVFIVGDANADRPLMHEAADEGAIVGFNAAKLVAGDAVVPFRRKVALGIAFSDPDVISVGGRFDALPSDHLVGKASGSGNGRARILGAQSALLHVYAQAGTGKLLGAAMVGAGGEHIAHLLAWAVQRGETAASLLQLPFYHPVLEEMLQTALQDIVRQLPALPFPMGVEPV